MSRIKPLPLIPQGWRHLQIGGVFFFLLLTPQSICTAQSTQAQADLLTHQGQLSLEQGQYTQALEQWQQAQQLYQALNDQEGIMGSQINQSLVLKRLGFYPRACKTLTQALQLNPHLCQTAITSSPDLFNLQSSLTPTGVIALHNLGNVLRQLGQFDSAAAALGQALRRAQQLNLTEPISSIRLSLANTHHTRYRQALNRALLSDDPLGKDLATHTAQSAAQSALTHYQQLATSPNQSTQVKAQLNWLQLYLSLERSPEPVLSQLQAQHRSQFSNILKSLLKVDWDQLRSMDALAARLSFSELLLTIKQHSLSFPGDPLQVALEQTQTALQQAQALQNLRMKSQAYGLLGQLYLQASQVEEAQTLFARALTTAQSGQAWDLAYQWQARLAQMYQRQGNRPQALQAYATTIDLLDQVRGTLLSANADLQFSFQADIEPIYHQYLQLLLESSTPDLGQVIQVFERLQLAELENYLQCGKLNVISLSQVPSDENTALIYILNLGDRYEVILRSPQGTLHHHTPNTQLVQEHLHNLRIALHSPRFAFTQVQWIQGSAQALYQQLLHPLKSHIPPTGNLHFVLDSTLQTLPMAILQDGDRYLIETYSLSTSLGKMRVPKAMPPSGLKTLIAGLSQASPSFTDPIVPSGLAPLPQVNEEVAAIKEYSAGHFTLLNETFTTRSFQAEVQDTQFPVLHIATHGQFSSDPLRTFLLAWNQPINVRELDRILRTKLNREPILELLVLSACQTAKGDPRSSLGIAGIANQAGARSTLASLWLVEDESTTVLMDQFYQGLKAGQSKAEAIRQAQLNLMQNPQYQHPFYWAPFILVGSWL